MRWFQAKLGAQLASHQWLAMNYYADFILRLKALERFETGVEQGPIRVISRWSLLDRTYRPAAEPGPRGLGC